MEKEYLRINTVLQPPKEIVEKIISLSQELGKKYDAHFILDGYNFYPHITVYSPEYPIDVIDQVVAKVEEVSKKFSPVEVKFVSIDPGQGFIGCSFELTTQIKELHETIVKELNPLRRGHHMTKYDAPDYKMKMNEAKKKNIAKYGYPSAMDLYHPHMTIIRLKDEKLAEEAAKQMDWDKSFVVDKLALYKMGEHGTCIDIIKEYKI